MIVKNQNKKPLDLDSGWENIVNPTTAKRRAVASLKVQRWLLTIVVLLAVILMTFMLWVASVVPAVMSLIVTGGCGCACCFVAGRLYETVKK